MTEQSNSVGSEVVSEAYDGVRDIFIGDEDSYRNIPRVVLDKLAEAGDSSAAAEQVRRVAGMQYQTGDGARQSVGDHDLRRRLLARVGVPLTASAGPKKPDDSFVPPKGVQQAAQRGLDLLKEGKGGPGLTDVGRARGKQLAGGQSVSKATLRKMHAYFSRHGVDQKKDWAKKGHETPGYVAWLLWGGDAGKTWADSMTRRFDNEMSAEEYVAQNRFDSLVSSVYAAVRGR